MKKPTIHSCKTLLEGEFFSLREEKVASQEGSYISMQVHSDAVVVLAQDKQGRYILNREYRYPMGDFILGCPGGMVEKGEEPIIAARRELYEESGYLSDDLVLMGSCYPFPGLCNQKIYFVYARNCEKAGEQKLDPLECIATELKSEAVLKKEIQNHSQIDGLLCIALWYKRHLR